VRNLAQNAFKHSLRRDVVELEFKGLRRGGLRIRVKDNGSGISKRELPFIFDQFYRGEMRAKQEGSGLGLYLVKHITTLHRGKIRAYSTLGVGTQIVIFLPSGK
jgi:signal transduction histidine kinase